MSETAIEPAFTVPDPGDLKARQRYAMELRSRAFNVREIADELETTPSVVNVWITSALREYIPAELREDVRALQLDRYERLLKAYLAMLPTCSRVEEIEKVGRLIGQVMQRIDILCGTERPKELNISGEITPVTQLDLELQEMIREAKARAATEEAEILAEQDEDDDQEMVDG